MSWLWWSLFWSQSSRSAVDRVDTRSPFLTYNLKQTIRIVMLLFLLSHESSHLLVEAYFAQNCDLLRQLQDQ